MGSGQMLNSSLPQDSGDAAPSDHPGEEGSSAQRIGEGKEDGDVECPEEPEGLEGGKEGASAGLSSFKSVPISKLSWRQRELLLKMIFKKVNEHQQDIHATRNKLKHAIRVL